MFTSDKQRAARYSLVYLAVTLFVAVFGAVYEHFSYEVWSLFMIYAFAVPLALGALPLSVITVTSLRAPGRAVYNLQASGIAALTVGSLYKGMLEIYGTDNVLTNVYWGLGAAFTAASLIGYLIGCVRVRRSAPAKLG